MKLTRPVWHGYTREAGEHVTPCDPPSGVKHYTNTDEHGCPSLWVRDSRGDLMNVWKCEVEA